MVLRMMNHKFFYSGLSLAVGSATLLVSSCASEPIDVPAPRAGEVTGSEGNNGDALKYNQALVEAIQNADKIVIKEHSNQVDFFGTIPDYSAAPQYTYARKVLSPGEKILFLEGAKKLKGDKSRGLTNCLFAPHHRIDFYELGQLKSSMKVCYKCNEIKWNGTSYQPSEDVFDAVTPAINRAGMKANRDWDALANQRYQDEIKPKTPGPDPVGSPTAKWAPGQKGRKVINPFTGDLVDVEGIPAKTKVRDPNDKDPSHVFRVPEQ